MITLKVDWPGKFFVAVESPTSDSGNLLLRNNRLTILDNRHESADERDVECLPFVWTSRLLRIRRKKTVDCAHAMIWRFIKGIIFHLHFVSAAQINAAIGVARTVDFNVKLEIPELPFCGDV